MKDPYSVVGYLADDLDVTRQKVRTAENAFGSLVADAYFDAFTDRPEGERADVAFENAGAIRDDGFCERRTLVERGSITRRVLREILPFDDKVVLIEVTGAELRGIFEHAVSALGRPGTEAAAGFFLHYSAGESTDTVVQVDCSTDFPAEVLSEDRPPIRAAAGQRIRRLVLAGVDVLQNPARIFRVAVNNFLAPGAEKPGGDNFVDLTNKPDVDRAPSLNFQVVEDYLRRKGTKENPLRAPAKGRILLGPGCG